MQIQTSREASRMNPCPVERLIGVDIADPGNARLIKKCDFDGPTAAKREAGAEDLRRKCGVDRIRSIPMAPDETIDVGTVHESNPAKPPLINNEKRVTIGERDPDTGCRVWQDGTCARIWMTTQNPRSIVANMDQLPGNLEVKC
jgi:hypothetical protein